MTEKEIEILKKTAVIIYGLIKKTIWNKKDNTTLKEIYDYIKNEHTLFESIKIEEIRSILKEIAHTGLTSGEIVDKNDTDYIDYTMRHLLKVC